MHMSISGAKEIIKKIFVRTLKIIPRAFLGRNIWRIFAGIFRKYFWKGFEENHLENICRIYWETFGEIIDQYIFFVEINLYTDF